MKNDINWKSMQEFRGRVAGFKVTPADTTGAGDAFVNGLLNSLAFDLNLIQVLLVLKLIKEII
jgi:sugar/nucleoside kinase (ribokinase family)